MDIFKILSRIFTKGSTLAMNDNPAILRPCEKHRGARLSSEQHGQGYTGGISAGFGLRALGMRMTGGSSGE